MIVVSNQTIINNQYGTSMCLEQCNNARVSYRIFLGGGGGGGGDKICTTFQNFVVLIAVIVATFVYAIVYLCVLKLMYC